MPAKKDFPHLGSATSRKAGAAAPVDADKLRTDISNDLKTYFKSELLDVIKLVMSQPQRH